MNNNLQTKSRFLALLFALTLGMGTAWAYNIYAVCPTGQTLYYTITDATNHYVTVVPRGGDISSGWNGYTKPTGAMVIPETVFSDGIRYTVTSISDYAFYYCSGLTSVTLPNSVTSIYEHAFYGCGGLTSVTIPNSVTSIGGSAFNNCYGLTSVTINSNAIASATYTSSSNLRTRFGEQVTSYTIGPEVTSIGSFVFYGCSNLTSVPIPNSVTSIGASAFSRCSGLTGSLVIPNSVTSIGSYAFYNCSGLASVTIPNSVTSIGGSAFSGCSGLTSVTIPNSVTSIGGFAFENCSGLASVTIPNSVTSIGGSAFSGCSGLTSVTIGNSVTSIGNNAFYSCNSLTLVEIPNSVTSIGNYAFFDCGGLTSVTIGSSVTSIGNYAFSGCSGLTSVTIPNSVTSIGSSAFSGCSGLTSVTIGNSVTSIGSSAFSGCSGLSSVEIPNFVISIGSATFQNCSSLTSVTIGNSVTSIGSSAFSGCSGLTSVTINSNDIMSATDYYYYEEYNYNRSLATMFGSQVTSYTIGPDVITIAKYAFGGCIGLTSVTIGRSVTSIGGFAFYGCHSLSSITSYTPSPPQCVGNIQPSFSGVPTTATVFVLCGTTESYLATGWNWFRNYVEFNDGYYCPIEFSDENVKSICVANWDNNSDGELNYWEAADVTDLESKFSFDDDITSFDELQYFTSLTSIGDYEFYYCSSLAAITLPAPLTDIGISAFEGCSSLMSITSLATTPPSVAADAFNEVPVEATIFVRCGLSATYRAATGWDGFTNYEEYDAGDVCPILFADANVKALCVANWDSDGDGELSYSEAAAVTNIGEVFRDKTNITSFDEMQYFTSLTSIGNYAFEGCSSLMGPLVIPNSVTSIGNSAFEGCSNLTGSLVIPNSVTSIGNSAFEGCSNLTGSLVIPNSVTSIGNSAFEGCSSLMDSLVIPNSVTSIGDSAFEGCSGLTSVYYIGDITQWCGVLFGNSSSNPLNYAHNLFIDNQLVTNLVIPNTVASIGHYAFNGCMGLVSVEIPNSVTSIGNGAFMGCIELVSITALAETPAIVANSNAFVGVPAYATVYVPCGTTEAYRAANGWSYFTNYSEIITDDCPIVFADANVKALCVVNWDINNDSELSYTEAAAVTDIGVVFKGNTSITSFDELQYFTLLANIQNMAFQGCTNLSSITLPSSITSIGNGSFFNCTGLTQMNVLAETPPSLGTQPFLNVPNTIPVYIPCESYETYQGWGGFTNFICNDVNFQITATASPEDYGTVTGGGYYHIGSTCMLTAAANAGYTFVNWTENGNPVSTDVAYRFTVTGSRTLVAIFVADGPIDYSQEYFTIESLVDNNTITLTIGSAVTQDHLQSVSYSTDNGTTWNTTAIDNSTQTISVTANAGDKVCWKGLGTSFASGTTDETNWSTFTATGQHEIYGNIMSLLYGDDFASQTVFPEGSTFTFYRLFSENTTLASAANLVLPALTLTHCCYSNIFRGCTSLVEVPELPATTLARSCYSAMFRGCTSLIEVPELPATLLADYCYDNMFRECTSLVQAPVLPATTLGQYCYRSMFYGCTSLTEAPMLPATTLAQYCYIFMFSGCTSLVEAPELPATSLAYYCYQDMFSGCTSLVEAPELPATSLIEGCYQNMFRGCTSLTEAPMLPATILADYCYDNMFRECTSLVQAPVLPAAALKQYCYRSMFYGCTSLTEAPMLPATTLAQCCYLYMFSGCTSLVEAPELPATTLALYCYDHMFYGCTSLNEVTCLATDISAQDCTTDWLNGVAATGTFHKNIAMEDWPTNSASGIPTGWNVEEVSIVCPVTATANPVEGGTVSGAGDYYYGSTCTLTAEPNEDWAFVSWSKDGTVVSYDNPYSFVVMEGGGYTASFMSLEGDHVIGEGSGNNEYLPSYSYYNYTLSQQIYTAEEIGESGNITSIAFLNAGGDKTRTYDIYMVHTAKTSFESNADWIAVTEADRVYSGSVAMAQGSWTTIAFDTPFAYDGVSNLAVVIDDNSGNWTGAPHMACRVFVANSNQAIRVYSDNTNYNPYNPSSYGGTLHNVKNQVIFGFERYMITVSADPEDYGTVTGGGYYHTGSTCTLTANANAGYTFVNWTENGTVVSTDAAYSFTVNEPRSLVANFSFNSFEVLAEAHPEEGGTVTGGGTYNYGETATLTATANEGYTFDHWSDGYEFQYFTIESLEDGNTITFSKPATITTSDLTSMSYSTDNGVTWTTLTNDGSSAQSIDVSLDKGDKAIWKGVAKRLNNNYGQQHGCHFTSTAEKEWEVSGNIMSLLYEDDFYGREYPGGGYNMTFYGLFCTMTSTDYWLKSAKNLVLPAAVLKSHCYTMMFKNNTGLLFPPRVLPAEVATSTCYYQMFYGCTSLVDAPEIMATSCEGQQNFYGMFMNCTSLTQAPELRITNTTSQCCLSMFNGCSNLTDALELPATTMYYQCYKDMFHGCTMLTAAPALPATSLATGCYQQMFVGCSSLTIAPVLSASTLASYSYNYMFSGCTALNEITCLATDITAEQCIVGWLNGVSSSGIFHKAAEMTGWATGTSGIPANWTVEDITTDYQTPFEEQYFTIESLEDGNTITLTIPAVITTDYMTSVSYSTDNGTTWNTTEIDGTAKTISVALPYAGDKVLWKGIGRTYTIGNSHDTNQSYFSGNKNHVVYGNIASLLYGDDFEDKTQMPSGSARTYQGLFRFNTKLVSAQHLVLPYEIAAGHCYRDMFDCCSALTHAPELPALTLNNDCYMAMFSGCTSLIQAPELPATALANECYNQMFARCTSMTQAPELPATTLSYMCYYHMFMYCTSLRKAPELPAATLTSKCYHQMFSGCSSLNEVTCLATDISAADCTANWLSGVASTGTFHKASGMNDWPAGVSGIPSGWTVFEAAPVDPTEPSFSYTVTGDRYWLANFTLNSYEINASASPVEGGTVTGTGTYNHFDNCTLTANANAGYTFVNWTENGTVVSTDAAYSFTVNEPRTLVAIFVADGPIDYSQEYFTIESLVDNNTITLTIGSAVTQDQLQSVSYSTDNGATWTTTAIDNTTQTISVTANAGDKVCWKGLGTSFASGNTDETNRSTFTATGQHEVYGNIMSLLYGNDFASQTVFPEGSTFTFYRLFSENTTLASAANLVLPAMTLTHRCYSNIFKGCTSLVEAPELPATTLADYCYQSMFYGCTSLGEAPALPATTLAQYCYVYMFNGCTSLTQAPALPATTMVQHCYGNMFQGCTSLVEAPELPATTLADYCYNYMFSGCTSLTEAPVLPATSLADYCYLHMFDGCTSLVEAPELPATSLKWLCYQSMFSGCTSLTEAPALPATTMAYQCYTYMFQGCTSLTEAPALPATTLAQSCYASMFYGCTSLTEAPALPATTMAQSCYVHMFNGCTSLAEAPALPATTLVQSCYGSMFQGCTSLVEAPELPATSLIEGCYQNMFQGCTSLTEAPALPATILADYCYDNMFRECASLVQAPVLPATSLSQYCYRSMFYGCASLNEVTCLATDISAQDCTTDWLNGVAATGTFHKNIAMEDWPTNSASGIPTGWNLEEVSIVFPITATANPVEGGTVSGAGDYYYGSTCSLTAEPNEDWAFVSWSKDGTVITYDNPYSFVVMEGGDYTASFFPLEGNHVIGEGSGNNEYLPSYSYYKYTLSQQIYTAEEIGESGNINSIAFLNAGVEKTRTYDIYLVHTAKTSFESNADWIAVTEADRVYSGPVTMVQGSWTTIAFDTPFAYDGVSNLAVVIDDNSGNWTGAPHMACRVFNANGNQAIRVYHDGTNYDPYNPSSYGGTLHDVKNQVIFGFERYVITVSADPEDGGTVTGGGYYHSGSTCTLTATPATGYTFINWTKDGVQVSTDAIYSFTVTENADFIAHFSIIATQSSNLAQGWNWWAPTVAATLQDLETALGVNGLAIMAEDGSVLNYANGQWNGTLESLVLGQMYRINTSSPCEFTLTGSKPASVEVSLAHGAHWFGFTGSAPTAVGTVFGTAFGPVAGDKVVSQNGGFAIYNGTAWQGTLATLLPGQGYVYVSQSNETKTLVME